MYLNINDINIHYPNLFKSAQNLYTYDNKILNRIDETFGDSLESIIEINKYNQAIEDIRCNISTNEYHNIAVNYLKLFNKFSDESFLLKRRLSDKDIYKILDILRDYFKNKN
jgi:uncharacterized coiled-coil DUF342 family protein